MARQIAIITGGSRGIGAATAVRLSGTMDVFLAADDMEMNFESVVRDCRTRRPDVRIEYGKVDFLDRSAAEDMIAKAHDIFGRIDVLVNNAAIRIRQPFGQFSHEDFDRMIAVNLRAPLFASQAVVPIMREQKSGRIIHVASQMGEVAETGSTLYGLTKAALIHLTKSMAYELASSNILVNAISPGPVMTEYNRERTTNDPALLKRKLSYIPASRYGQADEIAEVIEFLARTEAKFLQGHNLVVDGGYTIH
jgi:NAD(P)-dependent dehydrogenase (short-subunit alcohol dehydrogenase family)